MTDDKVVSEGPYKLDEENGQCCVVGPGYQKPGARITQNGEYWPTRMLQLDMNLAYAAGRKSMEKDFQDLFNIANKWSEFPLDSSDEFDAWKQARGIE